MSHSYYNWLGFHVINTAPLNVPLWFIRDLMVVFLFTPILYFLIKKIRLMAVFLLCIAYALDVWPEFPGFSSKSVFFVSIGAYFSIIEKKKNYSAILSNKFFTAIFGLSLILLLVVTYYDGRRTDTGAILYPFFVILGTLSLLLGFYRYNHSVESISPNLLWLSHTTFFVFASHNIILPYVKGLIYKIPVADNYLFLTFRYFFIPIITIFLVLAINYILNAHFPKLLSVLTGNRK